MIGVIVRHLFNRLGIGAGRSQQLPPDFDAETKRIIREVRPYTMTSPERTFALVRAVEYVTRRGVPGAVVECGVWRGGSMMAAAKELLRLGQLNRDLYLFDTYEGMTEPTATDVSLSGSSAQKEFVRLRNSSGGSKWCYASLDEVKRNLLCTGYPEQYLHFIKGDIISTVPAEAPAEIAVLRLDTDWYESTRHELVHLFPRLAQGGVLIVDDYGHWQGSKRAVDEYFEEHGLKLLLNRVDYTARVAIKS